MSKSQRLRLGDFRHVHELIERISSCGDRPEIWRHAALEGLIDLLHGNVGITANLYSPPQGIAYMTHPLDVGWQTESARLRFLQYATTPEMADDPGTIRVLEAQKRTRLLTTTRRELIEDGEWYSSPCVSEARRTGDVDDFVIMSIGSEYCSHAVCIYRSWNDRPFEERQRRIMRLFGVQLLRAIRENTGPKLIAGQLPHLSPRLRQTLEMLLTPMKIQEIANHLEISQHTVVGYRKQIYTLLNVNSRAELMSGFRPSRRSIRLPVSV